MPFNPIVLNPIGIVSCPRTELIDDNWGSVDSAITLNPAELHDDAVLGLETFSHIEVVFYFHRVAQAEIERGARRPRGRADWPMVGILAQRAKSRPSLIGVSRCRLLSVDGLVLRVRGLDAVDQTPVLDIKPYMAEFQPIGEVVQPSWSREVMTDYYK
jgi:tRNA-Thr(GGU) m(6)t(6)A37 methyltransferase TsaA